MNNTKKERWEPVKTKGGKLRLIMIKNKGKDKDE